MSLLGNLEDLGLGDILQIVSLSKKSGVLILTARARSGRIIFKDGKIIGATVSTISNELGDLLVKSGMVPQATVETARQAWNEAQQAIPLRQILVQQHHISPVLTEDAVREHIQQVVVELFSWIDGEFNFELQDVDAELASLDPVQRELTVTEGISPQFLSIEALRILDERAYNSPDPGAADSVPPPRPVTPSKPPAPSTKPPELGRVIPLKRSTGGAAAAQAAQPDEVPPPVPSASELVRKTLTTPVIVVDDDKVTLNAIVASLKNHGFQPHPVDTVEGAKSLVTEFEARALFYVVVADLLMPRSDGAGILGGIELLEFARTLPIPKPTVIVSDYENETAQKKALDLGANQFIRKPKKGDLLKGVQSEELLKFMKALTPLLADWITKETGETWHAPEPLIPPTPVAPAASPVPKPSAPPAPSRPPSPPGPAPQSAPPAVKTMSAPPAGSAGALSPGTRDIGGEIAQEIGAEFKPVAKSHSAGLGMLRQMSQELNNPESNIEITLLVLRFAAELMSRAVIFLVTDREIRGLGQFGLEIPGANPTRVIRTTVIPLKEESVLANVAQTKNTHKGSLDDGKWNDYLLKQLGGYSVSEVFVAPIVSRNRCVALLYGDNAGIAIPIGDTEALEIFLVQAGMAMDRAILERRLGELARAIPQDRG